MAHDLHHSVNVSINVETSTYLGQRCFGRNFDVSLSNCCTPENPCGEGEGDCDGHRDCKQGLVCGRDNCRKFGNYYHVEDDCCERSTIPNTKPFLTSYPGIVYERTIILRQFMCKKDPVNLY